MDKNCYNFNNLEYQNYLTIEMLKEKNKLYDSNINIRDLYPISIHTNEKKIEDINLFYELNDIILNLNDRISRRVTKREIVYKKDKSKSIIAIKITKNDNIRIFMLPIVDKFDINKQFNMIPKASNKPLCKYIKISNNEDINYFKLIIIDYIDYVLNYSKSKIS